MNDTKLTDKEIEAYHDKRRYGFENYLTSKHGEQYTGLDDDMPDDFNRWLCDIDPEDLIEMANEWGLQAVITSKKPAKYLNKERT